jgi:hypothetical protein
VPKEGIGIFPRRIDSVTGRVMAVLRRVTAQAIVVDPELEGRPLAPPWRRLAALLVDAALLLLPSAALAVGAATLALRLEHPGAFRALRALLFDDPSPERRNVYAADLAPVLVDVDAPGVPVDLAYAIEHGDRARVEELVSTLDVNLMLGGNPPPPRAGQVTVPVAWLIPPGARTLALLGLPALYFTLAHRGRRGRTLGKRLLGISVRRLDGKPLGLLDSLERFGGYFGVAGTVGIGAIELWRDPLRRLGHDRGAGTVVLLDREPAVAARPVPTDVAPAPPPETRAGAAPSAAVRAQEPGALADVVPPGVPDAGSVSAAARGQLRHEVDLDETALR